MILLLILCNMLAQSLLHKGAVALHVGVDQRHLALDQLLVLGRLPAVLLESNCAV